MSVTSIAETTTSAQVHPAIIALQREQKRRRELEAYLAWEDELFANPHLSATHKLTLRATRRAAERAQTRDETGKARVNLGSIAEQIGTSPDTVSRSLKVLETTGALESAVRHELQETGEIWKRVYVAMNDEALQKPKALAPEKPRNHGGQRYVCPKCGNDEHLKIRTRRTLVCPCGHESLIEETEQAQEPQPAEPAASSPADTLYQQDAATEAEPDHTGKLRHIRKPVTPPMPQDAATEEPLSAAAALLGAIAGPALEHIAMNRWGDNKYRTIARTLTEADVFAHLRGDECYGASCRYPDGTTRALCWDGDNAGEWHLMETAARTLAEVGYLPILEPSPSGRGGHLWIIFDALVDAEIARRQVYQLVPDLATLKEYWPGPVGTEGWNRVRLPGGRYVRLKGQPWCHLISVADGEVSQNGEEAARLLLNHQTPAPQFPPQGRNFEPQAELSAPADQVVLPTICNASTEIDATWQAKYGDQPLWFAFTPTYVAAWWNEQHPIESLVTTNRGGYASADWRGETEPSVYIRREKQRFEDYGASARRPDGGPDTGDALELQTRLSQASKSAVLCQAGKELVTRARTDLENAARDRQPIPDWLEPIITDAGRAHYARLRGYDDALGGVTGFQPLPIAESLPLAETKRQASATESPSGVPLTAERQQDTTSGEPGATVPEQSVGTLLVAETPTRQAEIRPAAPCPVCGSTTERLKYGKEWVCAGCDPNPFTKRSATCA